MEEWKRHKRFSKYEVSNTGKVRNSKTGRILKTNIGPGGYEHLTLFDQGKQHNMSIHRMVAETFYDGDHENMEVNHIDGNKTNNVLTNLEFCTKSENALHAFDLGLRHPRGQIRVRVVETGEVFDSIRECGRSTGCDQSMICGQLNGRLKHVNGYHFEKI